MRKTPLGFFHWDQGFQILNREVGRARGKDTFTKKTFGEAVYIPHTLAVAKKTTFTLPMFLSFVIYSHTK